MKWILLFACLLNGVITAPLFPLAPAHINANAPPHIASGLCAKFYMMPPLATAFGWVLMGIFLALDLYYIGFVFVAIAHLYMATIYWKLPTKPTKITDKAAVTPVATTATPDPMGQGTNQLQSRRGSSLMDPGKRAAERAREQRARRPLLKAIGLKRPTNDRHRTAASSSRPPLLTTATSCPLSPFSPLLFAHTSVLQQRLPPCPLNRRCSSAQRRCSPTRCGFLQPLAL